MASAGWAGKLRLRGLPVKAGAFGFAQTLSRVLRMKIMKAATKKTTMSIQFWPLKPKRLNV
jgi:hypothetical protein